MWISTPAVLRLVAMMAHCFALGKAGSICLPTESLSPNREEVYGTMFVAPGSSEFSLIMLASAVIYQSLLDQNSVA